MKTTPYRMTPDIIRRVVKADHPGAYVLGDVVDGVFSPRYVGRSDHCLRTRLLTHNYIYQYPYFFFAYARNEAEAYAAECKWWHDCYNQGIDLRNKIHPDSPTGQGLSCPYCQFADAIEEYLALKRAC